MIPKMYVLTWFCLFVCGVTYVAARPGCGPDMIYDVNGDCISRDDTVRQISRMVHALCDSLRDSEGEDAEKYKDLCSKVADKRPKCGPNQLDVGEEGCISYAEGVARISRLERLICGVLQEYPNGEDDTRYQELCSHVSETKRPFGPDDFAARKRFFGQDGLRGK